jgi:hypothetical protein
MSFNTSNASLCKAVIHMDCGLRDGCLFVMFMQETYMRKCDWTYLYR